MHGKQFLLDGVYAGIDEKYVYGRLDFAGSVPENSFELVVNVESWANHATSARRELRVDAAIEDRRIRSWKVTQADAGELANSVIPNSEIKVALGRNFEFRLPLTWLLAAPLDLDRVRGPKSSEVLTTHLRLRFSMWKSRLPMDALPLEGWMDLELLKEEDLFASGQ
jgi:hypothetical protein